ncbi:EpsG family protein [Undibacterium sp. RuRC25W]|uniref:EpsG family protein n=1 Tax=Undibacterium sp. RuRC25W TaxID=3413047 RepID=UPI003BF0AA2B
MNSSQSLPRLIFGILAVIVCLILSFRPIPSLYSDNDTGRYVDSLHLYCAGVEDARFHGKEASFEFFYAVTSPACLVQSDGLFLLEVAFFSPLIFLLFVKWKEDTFLWACSILFSMVGIELMINAMRQGLSMLLLFGAIYALKKNRLLAASLGIMSAVAHSSVLFYTPFLLWLAGARVSKKTMRVIVGGIAASCLLFSSYIVNFLQLTGDLDFFTQIYSDESSVAFILYITLPLIWVYGIRFFFERELISDGEKIGLIYSAILLVICLFLFPAIYYRFAILSVVLQIFLINQSEKSSVKVAKYAFLGMFIHLLVMIFFSKNYLVLING